MLSRGSHLNSGAVWTALLLSGRIGRSAASETVVLDALEMLPLRSMA